MEKKEIIGQNRSGFRLFWENIRGRFFGRGKRDEKG